MPPCLWNFQVHSVVFSPLHMGRHCIFRDFLGPCCSSYANPHPVIWLGAFYTSQGAPKRRNEGATHSKMILRFFFYSSQSTFGEKFFVASSFKYKWSSTETPSSRLNELRPRTAQGQWGRLLQSCSEGRISYLLLYVQNKNYKIIVLIYTICFFSGSETLIVIIK